MGSGIANKNFSTSKISTPYLPHLQRKAVKPSRQFNSQGHLNQIHPRKQNGQLNSPPQPEVKRCSSFISLSQATFSELSSCSKNQAQNVKNVHKYPYSAVGAILSRRNGMLRVGTGCLIGPNLVLTCAHNCFSRELGQLHEQIEYLPSVIERQLKAEGEQLKGKGFKIKDIYIPQSYQKSQSEQAQTILESDLYDYALLVLETQQNLEQCFGSFGFRFSWEQSSKWKASLKKDKFMQDLHILGYYPGFNGLKIKEYSGQGLWDSHFLLYTMKTKPGVSGAPVFTYTASGCQIMAIHQSDISKIIDANQSTQTRKAGLKLSREMFKDIHQSFRAFKNLHNYNLESASIDETSLLEVVKEIRLKQDDSKQKNVFMAANLSHNVIGSRGCHVLTSKSNWRNLYALYLNNCQIEDTGCRQLSLCSWPQLCSLELWGNNIGDLGCEYLSFARWANLQELMLNNNRIEQKGCLQLSRAQWPKMAKLNLGGNRIGVKGFRQFDNKQWNIFCDAKYRHL